MGGFSQLEFETERGKDAGDFAVSQLADAVVLQGIDGRAADFSLVGERSLGQAQGSSPDGDLLSELIEREHVPNIPRNVSTTPYIALYTTHTGARFYYGFVFLLLPAAAAVGLLQIRMGMMM